MDAKHWLVLVLGALVIGIMGVLIGAKSTKPIKVIEEVIIEAIKDPDKEIQKITYCIQSLQPRHSYGSALLIAKATYKECAEKGISVPLWIGLMFAESDLDPMQISATGAIGLCQIKYKVWKDKPELSGVLNRNELFWTDINIRCGTSIFKKYYEESGGKTGLALWRYNSGQAKLPDNKKIYELEFVNKVMYYTFITSEMKKLPWWQMQMVVDLEIQPEPIGVPIIVVPTKKPITK